MALPFVSGEYPHPSSTVKMIGLGRFGIARQDTRNGDGVVMPPAGKYPPVVVRVAKKGDTGYGEWKSAEALENKGPLKEKRCGFSTEITEQHSAESRNQRSNGESRFSRTYGRIFCMRPHAPLAHH